jgi:oxalate decarboxylase/phosphoglucose isomerase-like protein (cupin superfamily)
MTTFMGAPADEIRVGRDRIRFNVTSEQSGGEVAVFEVRMPPGGGPAILHRHEPFELYRVRSGELAIYLEGKDGNVTRTVAGQGAVVPIGSGLEHTVRNESDEDAEAVVVFSPGDAMERFARAAGELGRAERPRRTR